MSGWHRGRRRRRRRCQHGISVYRSSTSAGGWKVGGLHEGSVQDQADEGVMSVSLLDKDHDIQGEHSERTCEFHGVREEQGPWGEGFAVVSKDFI